MLLANGHNTREPDWEKLLSAISSRLDIIDRQVQSLTIELEKVLVPMAEQNRQLLDRLVDEHIVLPYALGLIEIIDRQGREIGDTAQGVMEFSALEDCRSIDRQELLNVLTRLGIEEFKAPRGTRCTPDLHKIIRVLPSSRTERHNRISVVIRSGFIRVRDQLVVRRALVEAWGPVAAVA
jgi:hypothetical protein